MLKFIENLMDMLTFIKNFSMSMDTIFFKREACDSQLRSMLASFY